MVVRDGQAKRCRNRSKTNSAKPTNRVTAGSGIFSNLDSSTKVIGLSGTHPVDQPWEKVPASGGTGMLIGWPEGAPTGRWMVPITTTVSSKETNGSEKSPTGCAAAVKTSEATEAAMREVNVIERER